MYNTREILETSGSGVSFECPWNKQPLYSMPLIESTSRM